MGVFPVLEEVFVSSVLFRLFKIAVSQDWSPS